jgi:hypothetical protein
MILGLVAAQAGATSWDLNKSNVDLGVYGNFATVDISVIDNTATFRIDANQALLPPPVTGGNYGIDKFFFNTKLTGIDVGDIAVAQGWEVTIKNGGSEASDFGKFEFLYKGTGNDPKNGTEDKRIDPLVFTITDPTISYPEQFYEANNDGYHFAAHIAGFEKLNGQTSVFVADGPQSTPVPEPGTILLLGAGLVGLGLFGRKRMKG